VQSHISNIKFLGGLLLAALLASSPRGFAQASAAPYAVVPRDEVNYSGPGRDADHDLQGPDIKIGLLAPLSGPQADEGKALLESAQLAIEDDAATPLPGGSGLWGRASSQIVQFVYEDRAVAIVTSAEGGSAHLAEQVGNKVGIPILTLSTDPTTTQINLPWIFRLGPTDTQQARVFARDIYLARKLKQVVLITDNDHDGRVGGEEFRRAARASNAPLVRPMTIDTAGWSPDSVAGQIKAQEPEALVFWTGYEIAARLAPLLRQALPAAPIYLCREAAQGGWGMNQENIWIVSPQVAASPMRESFERHYRARTEAFPSPAAAQTYDAIRLLNAALRRSGPNRARLRDALAGLSSFAGVSGVIAFDHAGNDLSDITLVAFPSGEGIPQ